MTRASRLAALFILLVLAATEAAPALADGTIDFAYGGRITEAKYPLFVHLWLAA